MRHLLLVLFSFFIFGAYAQTNLVENPTFKQTEKGKIKEAGMIEMAAPWSSPTLVKSDLYNPDSKSFFATVPENDYGEEKPMEDEGYAGFRAYSYKNKEPRSYLQGKLTQKLEAGKEYCVSFHVSLADLSKYACNHLAIAVTDKALTANNSEILQFDSYIESKRLKLYEQQYYWTEICGKYKAKGGEEYIVIGNFTPNEKVKTEKLRRPKGFYKPQKYDSYYYVDNVSVVSMEEVEKCNCDVIPGMENAETVARDFSSDKNVNTKTVKIVNTDGSVLTDDGKGAAKTVEYSDENVDGMIVSFNPKSFDLSADEIKKLDFVVAYLKNNIDEKAVATGYKDKTESDVEKLDGRRVSAVYKYIVSKGIPKERVERNMGGTEGSDEKDQLKNMKVTIAIEATE